MTDGFDYKKAYFKLKEGYSTLQHVLDRTPAHIYWQDLQGRYSGCNKGQALAAGLTQPSDIIGKTNQELPWNADNPEIVKNLDKINQKILCSGRPITTEEIGYIGKKNKRTYLSTKEPLYDADDTIVGLLGISVDITHLKEIEADLKKSKQKALSENEAKEKLLQSMEHELRTPLNAVLGFASILRNKENLEFSSKIMLDNIIEAASKIPSFLDLVSDYVNIEKNGAAGAQDCHDLKAILSAIYDKYESTAQAKEINFFLDFQSGIPTKYFGYSSRTRQILDILVNNAMRFTDKGEISIGVKKISSAYQEKLEITIADTGPGISANTLERLFNFFENSSEYDKYQDLGPRIALCKLLIQAMDGKLTVSSKQNSGTTFTIELPFRPFKSKTDSGEKKRLLIVEDDNLTQKLLASFFSKDYFAISFANTGKEALKHIDHQVDLMLIDIGLPDIKGLELTKKIRQQGYSTPILAITAHSSTDDLDKCLDAGMNDFITKPFDLQVLQKAVDRLINCNEYV